MPDYRAFSVGDDGRFNGSRAFFCENDKDAIVWAKQIFSDQPVELRCGERVVKRLWSPAVERNKVAASHEVHEGRMVPKDE